MATIGLYDIDFNHGPSFSISLPLMKAYNGLIKQGHQVIMMKPYELTGRFNKIFYFKDSPKLVVPKKLVIPDKEVKMLGYGFYKTSGLSTEEIINTPPSFVPYDLCSNRIKNKDLYNSIKSNSLVDWREKDFTGVRNGAGITYVYDRDFLSEPDWEELFDHFDNNIKFLHKIKSDNKYDNSQILKFIEKPYVGTEIIVHSGFDVDLMKKLDEYKGITYDYQDEMDLFMQIMISKIIGIKISFEFKITNDFFIQHLLRWNNLYGRISFKEYMTEMNIWDSRRFINFPYRILLTQDPKKITYNELVEEYLVK